MNFTEVCANKRFLCKHQVEEGALRCNGFEDFFVSERLKCFLQRLPQTISTLASHMESKEQHKHTELEIFASFFYKSDCDQRSQSFRPPVLAFSSELQALNFQLS